jgi:hypothetical protein
MLQTKVARLSSLAQAAFTSSSGRVDPRAIVGPEKLCQQKIQPGKNPRNHWIGGRVGLGPRLHLEDVKNLLLHEYGHDIQG